MSLSGRGISLKTLLDEAFLPVALSFTEESVRAFGFGTVEADRIRLASEEIFLYLCEIAKGRPCEIEVTNGAYYVRVRFLFDAVVFDPYALNLTARVAPDEQGLKSLGLLIASRSVDQFYIQHSLNEGIGFVLIKEKGYTDVADPAPAHTPVALEGFTISTPDTAAIKRFARMACAGYDEIYFPSRYRHPAKVADMAASGDYHLLVAAGRSRVAAPAGSAGRVSQEIGGGLLWRRVGRGMIEFFGPYIFDTMQKQEIAAGLADHFLGQVAKTNATFAATSYATPDLPAGYFETLGDIKFRLPGAGVRQCPFFYRQLHEDMGSQVWSHPDLVPFLRSRYDHLVLPREILTSRWEGEKRNAHSVLTVRFDRPVSTARLRPAWDGEDAARNIADHVAVLTDEGFANIFFDLDLGQSWQCLMTPALLENGFAPVLLLPGAGEGDIVVLQLCEPTDRKEKRRPECAA
jgi:anti-sigma regulatory factor (Ser/Thr protein kinase)